MRASWIAVGSIGLACATGSAAAQPKSPAAGAPEAVTVPAPPRVPPLPQPPVEYLRQLLAMKLSEREQTLASQPEPVRQWWRQKLREYDGLKPDEQGARLRAVELRWELLSLMKTAPARRAEKLQTLPEADRKFIEFRLQQWDALPAPAQNDIWENETTILYFLRLESGLPATEAQALQRLPPEDRKKLETKLSQWRALAPEQRQQMLNRFNRFFELTTGERQKILGILPEPQRRQTEQALKTIEQLPQPQRQQVIQSLRRFAAMTSVERVQFLQNAARWEAMSPREREAWLNLVRQVPPLPPGLKTAPPLPPGLMPPLPPPPAARLATGSTNQIP